MLREWFKQFHVCRVRRLHTTDYGLQQVGNRIPSAGTVVKFIIKSSLFILSLNRDSSASD